VPTFAQRLALSSTARHRVLEGPRRCGISTTLALDHLLRASINPHYFGLFLSPTPTMGQLGHRMLHDLVHPSAIRTSSANHIELTNGAIIKTPRIDSLSITGATHTTVDSAKFDARIPVLIRQAKSFECSLTLGLSGPGFAELLDGKQKSDIVKSIIAFTNEPTTEHFMFPRATTSRRTL
jgi:hypothetical protein